MIVELFVYFLLLSLLSTGGAITLAPEMYRYLVNETGWLTDMQFTSAIAIAQASPGPNLLFVTVLGWLTAGPLGALATTFGVLLPSAILVVLVNRLSRSRANAAWVKAVKEGLAPVVIALMLATTWILSEAWVGRQLVLVLVGGAMLVACFTRVPPVLVIALGALLGALGVL